MNVFNFLFFSIYNNTLRINEDKRRKALNVTVIIAFLFFLNLYTLIVLGFLLLIGSLPHLENVYVYLMFFLCLFYSYRKFLSKNKFMYILEEFEIYSIKRPLNYKNNLKIKKICI